jgi:hypothetical protein
VHGASIGGGSGGGFLELPGAGHNNVLGGQHWSLFMRRLDQFLAAKAAEAA